MAINLSHFPLLKFKTPLWTFHMHASARYLIYTIATKANASVTDSHCTPSKVEALVSNFWFPTHTYTTRNRKVSSSTNETARMVFSAKANASHIRRYCSSVKYFMNKQFKCSTKNLSCTATFLLKKKYPRGLRRRQWMHFPSRLTRNFLYKTIIAFQIENFCSNTISNSLPCLCCSDAGAFNPRAPEFRRRVRLA